MSDDKRHQGFNNATIHNQFNIVVDGDFHIYERGEEANYDIEWAGNYPLAEGVIRLQRNDTYKSSEAR